MRVLTKSRLLLRLLLKDPVEFYDRISTILEVQCDRMRSKPNRARELDPADALTQLAGHLPGQITALACESSLLEIERKVADGIQELRGSGPFIFGHNADIALSAFSYLVCRALEPTVVLETGVAYGVTSAFVLQALSVNRRGELWSVDLPPLGREADRYVGALIPSELRGRWHLHRGPSRRILPALLPSLRKVDVFIHDSLHTHRNVAWEFG